MKAVRSIEGGVAVVDLDEPPGSGELVQIASASICASDLGYIQFGSRAILGHELAGHLRGRHPGGRRGHLRVHGLRAVPSAVPTTCARPTPSGLSGVSADGGMAEHFRAPAARLVPLPARPGRGRRVARRAGLRRVACAETRRCRTGYTVAVVGAGALGLLAVPGARRQGAVTVVWRRDTRISERPASSLGARIGTDGIYDVVDRGSRNGESLARSTRAGRPRRHRRGGRRAHGQRRDQLVLAVHEGGAGGPVARLLRPRRQAGDGGCRGHAGRRPGDRPHAHHPSFPPPGRPSRPSGWRHPGPAPASGWCWSRRGRKPDGRGGSATCPGHGWADWNVPGPPRTVC